MKLLDQRQKQGIRGNRTRYCIIPTSLQSTWRKHFQELRKQAESKTGNPFSNEIMIILIYRPEKVGYGCVQNLEIQ